MKRNVFLSQAVYSGKALAVLFVVLACLWIIVSVLRLRLDVTQERFFTLSAGSRSLIEKLPSDVTIKFYFSRSAKNIPIPIKAYSTRVEDFLRQYADAGRGKITLEVLDPRPDTDADTWARRYGLNPVPLGDGTEMFFGIAFFAGKKESAIAYIDPRREQFLEYDIGESLQKLLSKERLTVGVMSSLKMISTTPVNDIQSILQGKGDWALVSELRKTADVEEVGLEVTAIPERIKVLIVHHPKNMKDDTLKAIDQFVQRGGKLIALVDPFSRTDFDRQYQEGVQGGTYSSDVRALFSAWDIEFDASKIVGDLKFPTQINAGGNMIIFPFFMQIRDAGFNRESMITSRLNQMIAAEAGFLQLRSGSAHQFDKLITTSATAGTIPADLAPAGPDGMIRRLSNENKEYTIAALVRGKFKSAFSTTKSATEKENIMLVIADADFAGDQYSVQRMQFANQIVSRPTNDNINFIVNAVDFLGGSEDLIAIRSRSRFLRPFDRLVEIQEKAQLKWKSEEDSLKTKLAQTQAKLQEMQGARVEGNKLVLTREQQQEIERFRSEESQMRLRLREVRKNLREDIESLGRSLSIANLVVVPLMVSVVGGIVFRRRARRIASSKQN